MKVFQSVVAKSVSAVILSMHDSLGGYKRKVIGNHLRHCQGACKKVKKFLLLFTCGTGHCTLILERFTTFARQLLLGPSDLKYSTAIIFDPNQGEVNKNCFRRDFGFQGQLLVEAYGKGFSKKELEDLGYL